MKRKRDCDRAVKVTISLPPPLWRRAIEAQEKHSFSTFSDLIQNLIRNSVPAEVR